MALLERVATLIKANVNDLISKAEDPEKLLRQLLLDMENQMMQVKTQLAVAMAGQHLLERKQQESLNAQRQWIRKAELALAKKDESLARIALEHSLTHETAASNLVQQIEDQAHQVEVFKTALHRLEQKMAETRTKSDLLIARHRRARLAQRAGSAILEEFGSDMALERLGHRVNEAEAVGSGRMALSEVSPGKKFEQLERADRVDKLLAELKAKAS